MKRTFTARVGGKEYHIEHESDTLRVNGVTVDFEVSGDEGGILRIDRHHFDVSAMRKEEDGMYVLSLNGKRLRIEIEDEIAALLKRVGGDKATKLHSAVVRSPMPGKIARVLVGIGELIEAGQGVLILEAMKMENEIKAPAAGIVKAIHVSESDAVEKNAALIEIS
ncbi:MAG: hypothetical protein KFF77_02450 [Bacteroidetes bacterium]|nr:hypothetical protein [Bacteroidota bacterium]